MKTLLTLAASLLAVHALGAFEPASPKVQTYVYKTVAGLPVELDVHRAPDAVARPVVVWIHGGALISGSRLGPPKDILGLCRRQGYALVSIDYRLAPEVKVPGIIEDLKDAFAWINSEGPKQAHLDPSRLVVAGGSAGGYLTMMVGVVIRPRPAALVAYYGYGDIDGDWYAKPSPFYRKKDLVSREDAFGGLDGKVTTGKISQEQGKARGRFYLYLRQNGLWTKEIAGFEPGKDRARLDPFCPVRNITPDYPPILMLHGDQDTDVPFQQSVDMDRELTRQKVPHEFFPVPGSGHGLHGGDKKIEAAAKARALEFIQQHLTK